MSSVSERGHAMNAAHFDELLETILTFKYEPSTERLKIDSMKTMSADCRKALNEVLKAMAAFKAAVDAREPVFDLMNKHITRIMNILKSSDVPKETVETCRSMVRKIHGKRTIPKRSQAQIIEDASTGIETHERSSSQRSYDNQLENFILFIEQILNSPGYSPNETDMQPGFLKAMAEELKQKNAAVISAKTALKDARAKRDNLMYKKETGLIDTALDAKSYIKGAFGPSSPEFRKVAKLEFSRN